MMFDQKAMNDEREAILETIAQALECEGARDISTICGVIREMKARARYMASAQGKVEARQEGYAQATEDAALLAEHRGNPCNLGPGLRAGHHTILADRRLIADAHKPGGKL